MDTQMIAGVQQTALALMALVFGYGVMYRKTRIDGYREDLFTILDELFDFMWKNDLDFDLPAYRRMRDLLNGAIRAAAWTTPLLVVLAVGRAGQTRDRLSEAIAEIADPEVRAHFTGVRDRFRNRFFDYLFAEGVLGGLVWLAGRLSRVRTRVLNRLRAFAAWWDEEFVRFGREDVPEGLILGRRARLFGR